MKIKEVLTEAKGAKEFQALSQAAQDGDKTKMAAAHKALAAIVGPEKAKMQHDHIMKAVKNKGKSV